MRRRQQALIRGTWLPLRKIGRIGFAGEWQHDIQFPASGQRGVRSYTIRPLGQCGDKAKGRRGGKRARIAHRALDCTKEPVARRSARANIDFTKPLEPMPRNTDAKRWMR